MYKKISIFTIMIIAVFISGAAIAQTFTIAQSLQKSDPTLINAIKSNFGCTERSCPKMSQLKKSNLLSPSLFEVMNTADSKLKALKPEAMEPETCDYANALLGWQDGEVKNIQVNSIYLSPSRAEASVVLLNTQNERANKLLLFIKVQNRWLLDDVIDRYSLKFRLLTDIDIGCSFAPK